MHFPSTLAASASLLATTVFVGPALAAAPKDIWNTTPSGFADSTASPVDSQLVVPIFTPSFRATPVPVTGSQDGIQARWEGHGQKWKPEFYCPYHRDFAKYQACVAIGQAEAVVKILDEAIIHLTEVSEPRGDEGCLERVDYAKFKACYVLPMLEKAEVFNQRMVDTLREAAIGPYDVQRPKSRRSIRVFSGDNHSVADGEDGFTTDNSDAQDAAMNQDGEGGWTTAEDEASGPKEAGMVADGDGGITTDDEAETTAWYANDDTKDAMREKIQKVFADLFYAMAKHSNSRESGSTDSTNIPKDKSALQVLSDWFVSRATPPVDPVVVAKVKSWADHYNKFGVLTPEAAAALGASTEVDHQTQAQYLAVVISSIVNNYDDWSWWIDALKDSSGH